MNNFVEKYKVQIGIFLILMIVAGTLILIYEKKELSSILGIKSNNNNDCSCQDYSEKIAVLEEKINVVSLPGFIITFPFYILFPLPSTPILLYPRSLSYPSRLLILHLPPLSHQHPFFLTLLFYLYLASFPFHIFPFPISTLSF